MNPKYNNRLLPVLVSRKWQSGAFFALVSVLVAFIPQLEGQQDQIINMLMLFGGIAISAFGLEDIANAVNGNTMPVIEIDNTPKNETSLEPAA